MIGSGRITSKHVIGRTMIMKRLDYLRRRDFREELEGLRKELRRKVLVLDLIIIGIIALVLAGLGLWRWYS